MNYKNIQNSTFDLLKNLDKEEKFLLDKRITSNLFKYIEEKNAKTILLLLSSEYFVDTNAIIKHCLNNDLDLYLTFHNKKGYYNLVKVKKPNFKKTLFMMYEEPYFNKKENNIHLELSDNKRINFDLVVLIPINFDNNNNFIFPITYNSTNKLLRSFNYKEICCLSYSFQKISELPILSNTKKSDVIIDEFGINKK